MRKAIALAVVSVLALAACSTSEPEVSTKTGGGDETTTGAGSNQTTTTAVATPDVEVTEVGLSSVDDKDFGLQGTAGAALVNHGKDPLAFFEVVFTFKDAAGKPVATETSYVYAIDPGGTAYATVEGVDLTAPATTVDASAVVDKDSILQAKGTVIPVTVGQVAPDEYLGLTVHGTAKNPGAEVIEGGSVECVLRKGGKIVGGVEGSLDTLTANAEVAWEANLTMTLAADAADCSGGAYS